VSSSGRYDGITRFLLDSDPVKAAHGEWAVLRVGRNPVWRIESRGGTFFVKIMKSPRYYQRERHGLEVSQRLARQHDWITAPELVYTNEGQGALITSALPGVGVGRLLRSAFRRDRNPFRRTAPIEEMLRAFSQVLRWLAELHRVPVTCSTLLFDHSITSMRDRILRKLNRAVEHGLLELNDCVLQRFRELQVSASQPEHLISGDATLGNFLWDGQRIGRVDFEDLGVGAPARDYSEIRQGLEAVGHNRWYWSVDQAVVMLPPTSGRVEEALYRLEWALDRHWPGERTKPMRGMRALERDIYHMLEAITG
jgi:aminoglycoside phosphotransferase (APT) family kinase protein